MKASKDKLDYFTKLKFVTSGLPPGRAAIENHPGTYYFCHYPNSENNIKELEPVTEPPIELNCIYRYRVLLDSDNMKNYSISMRANNHRFWDLGGSDGEFIRATGKKPVYFEVREPPPPAANVGFTDLDYD